MVVLDIELIDFLRDWPEDVVKNYVEFRETHVLGFDGQIKYWVRLK